MDFKPSKVGLSRATLNKGGRLDAFINKYRSGDPFFYRDSTDQVVLDCEPESIYALEHGEIPLSFTDVFGNRVLLSELQKTPEFGGKGGGWSVKAETTALESVKDQLNDLKGWDDSVELTVGNSVYQVSDVVSTPGTPKSDFHFVDPYGEEVAWVSHKDGNKPRSFGQWGGMSDREMAPVYEQYPEVQDEIFSFVEDVKDFIASDQMPRATTVARPIKNEHLKMVAIFGNEYGGPENQQNVSAVIQGCVKIEGGRLVGTGGTHANGDEVPEEYEPMLMAMYKGDRDQFGIRGARFSIYPRGGRLVHKEI